MAMSAFGRALALGGILMLLGCRHASESSASSSGIRSGDLEELAVDVVYDDNGVVIASCEGVAAVKFTETISNGCRYTYRFLPAGETEEETGEGEVFENYRAGPTRTTPEGHKVFSSTDLGSELFVVAGRITLKWSKGGERRGYLYFMPERERVHLLVTFDFESLDLSRFAK